VNPFYDIPTADIKKVDPSITWKIDRTCKTLAFKH